MVTMGESGWYEQLESGAYCGAKRSPSGTAARHWARAAGSGLLKFSGRAAAWMDDYTEGPPTHAPLCAPSQKTRKNRQAGVWQLVLLLVTLCGVFTVVLLSGKIESVSKQLDGMPLPAAAPLLSAAVLPEGAAVTEVDSEGKVAVDEEMVEAAVEPAAEAVAAVVGADASEAAADVKAGDDEESQNGGKDAVTEAENLEMNDVSADGRVGEAGGEAEEAANVLENELAVETAGKVPAVVEA